jgi:glucan phosphoethanolaminetransferase (alkaline phosphatase superfamily)
MQPRSTFVTVLAWILIIFAGFATLISLLQVVMVSIMFASEELQIATNDSDVSAEVFMQFFSWLVYAFAAISLITFVSAIGLLKRKNWARLFFVVVMVIGIVWQIAGLALQLYLLSDLTGVPEGDGFEGVEQFSTIVLWFSVALGIAMSVLFGWIIRKLTTEPVRNEFVQLSSDDMSGPQAAIQS